MSIIATYLLPIDPDYAGVFAVLYLPPGAGRTVSILYIF